MSNDIFNLLNYLYNDFAVSFVICLCGAIIKDVIDTYKNTTKIKIEKIIFSSIFIAVLLCAINGYINIEFNIYIFVCLLTGLWSENIIKIFTSSKIILIFLNKFLSNFADPLFKSISDTIDEYNGVKKGENGNSDTDKNKDDKSS